MAAVTQFAEVSDWTLNPSPLNVTGLSWNAGDMIVAVTACSDSTGLVTPTNANLSFTLWATEGQSSITEAGADIYVAQAGSSETSQTVVMSRTGSSAVFGAGVYVVGPTSTGLLSVGDVLATLTESALSRTVDANSVVIYHESDVNAAGLTTNGTTGSGTRTKRYQHGDLTNYDVSGFSWNNTSAGTFSWGLTSYSGHRSAQVYIEIAETPTYIPENLVATAIDSDSIGLTWDAVDGVTRYVVERDGVIIDDNVLTNSYTDNGLSPATTYSYYVMSVLP